MNDKIKELAEQSYEAATITTIDPFTQEVVVDYIDGTKPIFNKEKFAELIVRECLAQVDKVDVMLEDDKEKTGVAWVGYAIEKHFGVEK